MQISPRKFNIIVFVTILVLIVFYFVFNLFLNNGMLSVTGQTPFEFTVKGNSQVCEVSPCEMKLIQGSYTLQAKKEGYGEEEADFLIKRRAVTPLEVNFEFVPMIRKLESRAHITVNDESFDVRSTPLSLSEGFELRPLPKSFSSIALSPSLKYAFFYGLDTPTGANYLLDIAAASIRKLNIGNVQAYKYAPKNDVLYFIKNEISGGTMSDSSDDSNIAQSLNSFVPGDIKLVSNFVKPLKSPKVFVSHDENFVVVYDADTGEVFLVNLLEDSRSKILTLMAVRDIKFSPSSSQILIGSALPGSATLLAYSIFDLKGTELKADLSIVAEPDSIVWRDENNIFYAIEQEYAPQSGGILNKIKNSDGLKIITNRNSSMVNYNLGFNKYSNLYEPKTFINRVDLQENGAVLFGDTDSVWEIKFQES
ncbi:MAG: hypothetical protein Q8P68_03130 [Candidatus Peregrinibacteria bacterium]|nr:hypothetical protein [Candidatus Peregrinibacteria bacterium]MDZ4244690.1 hypothetical protein [Candidatus Gracilibacteria bacterium]